MLNKEMSVFITNMSDELKPFWLYFSQCISWKVAENFNQAKIYHACIPSSIVLYEILRQLHVPNTQIVNGYAQISEQWLWHAWVEILDGFRIDIGKQILE